MAGASTPAPCRGAALTSTVGRSSAAAGTAYETLLITNHSSHACDSSPLHNDCFATISEGELLRRGPYGSEDYEPARAHEDAEPGYGCPRQRASV